MSPNQSHSNDQADNNNNNNNNNSNNAAVLVENPGREVGLGTRK
jgi:hypothetical protein